MPAILRVIDREPASWRTALGRAATLGFDTLLLPSHDIATPLVEAAAGLGVTLLADLDITSASTTDLAARPGPFTPATPPLLDPRTPAAAPVLARAAIATPEDAVALATWWTPVVKASPAAGLHLLGLADLPSFAVLPFLETLRAACPGALLFADTSAISWSVLATIPAHTLDLVSSSLPWWDSRAEWLWQELAVLRRIAPVVTALGPHASGNALAATLSEGWMATLDTPGLEALQQAHRALFGLPWTTLVSPGGGPAYALLHTDTPDPRRAARSALSVTALSATTLPASLILGAVATPRHDYLDANGRFLGPADRITLESGALVLYTAAAGHDTFAQTPAPLTRKRAELAAQVPRIAIEAPTPCVEHGRFPARQTIGSEVVVECDLIADGHDHLAAVLRWRAPGLEDWTEVPMKPLSNDRWTARFPLNRLGIHHYTIEAWKDVYDTYTDELFKKHAANVPTELEIQEGTILLRKAAARSSRKLQALLTPILAQLEAADLDGKRTILLAPATRDAMSRADDRPHRVALDPIPLQCERPGAAFASWYEVFPRSMSGDPSRHGTFRDVARQLPRIQAMGFDVLYFPPIHPIGRINRKGPNNTLTPGENDPGSPYAIGNEHGGHDAIHPELGTIEDFQHLCTEAAAHGIELALDFAVQCAPDHPWLKQHKGWFDWRPDGTIRYAENPPKKYQDIVNVDFYGADAIPDLWLALANAVLFWARQGIRLFRVDNPHTKPLPFWEWMIAEVQARFPDTVFLAEAFTRPKVMYRLAKVGFSQSYTYFTWRNTKSELTDYFTELSTQSPRDFFRPHLFVNTPDINPIPLQGAPRQAFLTRAALATTLSGLWGLYNGFELLEASPVPGREEYLDSEKYQIRTWDWDRPGNIAAEITQLNAVRRQNPALQNHLGVFFLRTANDQVLLFEKATLDRSNVVLVAVSLSRDPQTATIEIPFWRWSIGIPELEPRALIAADLLRDTTDRWTAHERTITLDTNRPYAIWRLRPALENE